MTDADTTPGWIAPSPSDRPGRYRNWILGCGLVLILLVVLVIAGSVVLFRGLGTGLAIIGKTGGQIDSFRSYTSPSGTEVTFQAARGLDVEDGPRLACDVLRPALIGTEWADTSWVIVNRAGDVIASDQTPCP